MDYVHCPRCKCAYNVATNASCPSCPVTMVKAEGSGPIRVAPMMATIPFSERAKAAAGWTAPTGVAANANVTAIVAPDPIAEMAEAAGMLMRAAGRITTRELVGAMARVRPREIMGAMLSAFTARAPRWLRS